MATTKLLDRDTAFIREAAWYLERPSWLLRAADAVGEPVEGILSRVMPDRLLEISTDALRRAMGWAAKSVSATPDVGRDFRQALGDSGWTGFWHILAASVTGGLGGAFGLAGLAVELPVTTGIMFRSICAIADDFGFSPTTQPSNWSA